MVRRKVRLSYHDAGTLTRNCPRVSAEHLRTEPPQRSFYNARAAQRQYRLLAKIRVNWRDRDLLTGNGRNHWSWIFG